LRRLIDAEVLIGALDSSDAHHAAARRLLSDWHQRQDPVAIGAVNLTEALIAPAADSAQLARAREAIAALGIEIRAPNEAIAIEAARLRQRHPVSLPDAYCLATAKHTKSSVTSFDQKVLAAARSEGLTTALNEI
jgi:predicted nucleic acid-binding protein